MAPPAAPGRGAGPALGPGGRLHLLQGHGERWAPAGGVPWVPWGGRGGRIHPAVPRIPTLPPQVILDCPADSCFEYIYQHEPYLRDPVAYPKVQVRVAQGG